MPYIQLAPLHVYHPHLRAARDRVPNVGVLGGYFALARRHPGLQRLQLQGTNQRCELGSCPA
jgi:hypothetical protein